MTANLPTSRLDSWLAKTPGYGLQSMTAGQNKLRIVEFSMQVIMRRSSVSPLRYIHILTTVNSVSLKLSHLQQDLEVAATQDVAIQISIPKELEYTTVSLGQHDIDASIGSRLAKRKLVQRTAADRTRSSNAQETSVQRRQTAPILSQQELMVIDEDNPLQAISQMSLETRENLIEFQGPMTTATETQTSTQTREDRATRGRLAKMVCVWACSMCPKSRT